MQTNPWPAVPDWPWCWNADAGLKKLTAGKNTHAGLTFLRHSGIYIWFFNIIQQPSMDVQGISLRVCSVDGRGVLFLSMPECQTVRNLISPVPEWTKTPMPEPVRFRDKRTQSGTRMLWYRTKIQAHTAPAAPFVLHNTLIGKGAMRKFEIYTP